MQKKVENMVFAAILAVFLLYFLLNYNLPEAINDMRRINIDYLPYIILTWIAFTSVKFLPWELALKKVKIKLPLTKSFLMMYAFFGIGMGSAGIGQLIPLQDLDKFKKNARFFSFSIMIFLGITGGMGAIILALASSILLSKFAVYLLFVFAATYIFTTLLGFDGLYKKLNAFLKKHTMLKKSNVVKSALKHLEGMRKQRGLMAQRYFLLGTFLFMPSLVLESLLLVFILASFNVSISLLAAVFIFTVSVIVGGVSMMPAGMGAEDISLIALMVLFNVPGVLAITALIIFRFLNTFIVTIAGYSTMAIFKLDKTRRKL